MKVQTILLTFLLSSIVGCSSGGGGGGETTVTPPTSNPPPSNDPVVVNVLAVVGQGADTYYYPESALVTRIQHLLDISTVAFQQDNIPVEFKLVQMYKSQYPASHTTQEALDAITLNQDPSLNAVHSIRDSYKADVVIFYRQYAGDGLCGLAWLGGNNGSFAGYSEYAYAVVAIDCPDYSTPHEIGHIFGLAHNKQSAPVDGAFVYGHGYGYSGAFSTIMAVQTDYPNSSRILQYSNPLKMCDGVACGVADQADSVRALKQSFGAISNYR